MVKKCWICHETEIENRSEKWIRPCMCRSELKNVHISCLTAYITSTPTKIRTCKFCNYTYQYTTNKYAFLFFFNFLKSISEYFLIGFSLILIAIGSYFALFLYGVTVLSLFSGITIMKEVIYLKSIRIFVALPIIPLSLLYTRCNKYSVLFHSIPTLVLYDMLDITKFWYSLFPLIFFFYTIIIHYLRRKIGDEQFPLYETTNHTDIYINEHPLRVNQIISTLLIPYISFIVGCVFPSKSICIRTICGSVTYILTKDILYFLYIFYRKRQLSSMQILEPIAVLLEKEMKIIKMNNKNMMEKIKKMKNKKLLDILYKMKEQVGDEKSNVENIEQDDVIDDNNNSGDDISISDNINIGDDKSKIKKYFFESNMCNKKFNENIFKLAKKLKNNDDCSCYEYKNESNSEEFEDKIKEIESNENI